jgi:hypothetical protein
MNRLLALAALLCCTACQRSPAPAVAIHEPEQGKVVIPNTQLREAREPLSPPQKRANERARVMVTRQPATARAGVRGPHWKAFKPGINGVQVALVAGDMTMDGAVNHGDIDLFARYLASDATQRKCMCYREVKRSGHCWWSQAADCNGDGVVNNADIDGFVWLITHD